MKIDITPIEEADPNWEYVDKKGHKHYWQINDIEKGDYSLPTLAYVEDVAPTDEYPASYHYECKKCGEVIKPKTRVPPTRRYITITN